MDAYLVGHGAAKGAFCALGETEEGAQNDEKVANEKDVQHPTYSCM
jgi:hypothetical protein